MRKGIVQLVAIGVVIGIAVTLVAVLFQWLPTSNSEEFDRIQDIYWFATIMSIVIFALVAAVVVYSVWKWRVPPDDDAEGPPIHGHTGLEIVWTAVPAILVIALGIVSAFVLSENGKASDTAPHAEPNMSSPRAPMRSAAAPIGHDNSRGKRNSRPPRMPTTDAGAPSSSA